MTAYFVVRAAVADPADRAPFDHWYRTEHLPDALKAFKAVSVHTAYYRFNALEDVRAISEGPAIKALIEEFDRV